MSYYKSYRHLYRGREAEAHGSYRVGPARRQEPRGFDAKARETELAALAASTTVEPVKVPEGKRTLSEKQMFLATQAPDSYQYDMRHFVGDLQAKVGMRNPKPVEPKPVVERDDEERAAERAVWARRDWGRYWARKRRATES